MQQRRKIAQEKKEKLETGNKQKRYKFSKCKWVEEACYRLD